LRIAHVGKVLHALHIQMMNFCVEGRSHFTRRPGKIDQQPFSYTTLTVNPCDSNHRVIVLRSCVANPNLSPYSFAVSH